MTALSTSLIYTILLCEGVSRGYRISYSSSSGLYTESDDGEGYRNGENDTTARQQQQQRNQETTLSDNHNPRKRAVIKQVISDERKQAKCFQRLKQPGLLRGPTEIAVYVEVGETATLTCQYCAPRRKRYASMIWKRMLRKRVNGYIKVHEVQVDMHDDESRNRITVGKDHTLIIKDARMEDVGIYFCQDVSETDILISPRMDSTKLNLLFNDRKKLRFHYSFDIIRPTDMKPREVSLSSGKKSMAPLKPQANENTNTLVLTTWQSWGQCSTCGQPGVRKRHGVCIIKQLHQDRDVLYLFMGNLLKFYKDGLPCRLTLFSGLPNSMKRPDEVEEETCNINCPLKTDLFTSSSMSVDEIKTSIDFDKEQGSKQQVKLRVLSVSAGETVNMSCPGVPVDWTVVWTNESRIVDVNVTGSGSRVTLHANNMLEINTVDVWDNATYRCVSRDLVKAKVKLSVTPRIVPGTATWLFAYFTSLTYPVDFLFFLLLMLVKHRHRRAGRRLNNIQLRGIESFSSQGSRRYSRQYLSSQTDASRRYLSSQTDTRSGYFSSQTDTSRRYISSQPDASRQCLYSSDASDRSRSHEIEKSKLRASNELVGDVLEMHSLLSSDSETLSNESDNLLENDVFTTPRTDLSDTNSDTEFVYRPRLTPSSAEHSTTM